MLVVFLPLLLHASLGLAQGNDTCYLLNGNAIPNTGTFFPAFAPCTSGGPSTVCCATNRTRDPGGDARDGEVKDECLPNGLCQNRRIKSGVETFSFFANHCTDPSYPSGKCLDICPSNRGPGGSAQVTSCSGKADSETWCCGTSRDCCASGMGVVRLAKVLGQALPSLSSVVLGRSSTSASMSIGTSMSLSSASATSTPGSGEQASSGSGQDIKKKDKKGLKGGIIAGIIVGVLALLLLIAAAVVIKKRRSKAKSATSMVEVPPPQYYAAEHRVEKDSRGLVELETPLSELPGAEAMERAGKRHHGKGSELDSRPVERP